MIVKKGTKAISFKLKNQEGKEVDSKKIKGKILLAFHPLAFTSVCTAQMQDLEFYYDEIKKKGVTALGVSVDAQPSKKVWANAIGLENLDILSDFNPKGELAEKLGIYIKEEGISGRAVILMDEEKVIWSKEYELTQRPDIEEIISHLED